uniref:Uncharacterized protein n=1 Tax=Janibacter limosus TaxID=53458 RepID=A0AC61U8W5_9MICO|nr:hypothetical protein [Janibacter limosus]
MGDPDDLTDNGVGPPARPGDEEGLRAPRATAHGGLLHGLRRPDQCRSGQDLARAGCRHRRGRLRARGRSVLHHLRRAGGAEQPGAAQGRGEGVDQPPSPSPGA